MNQLVRAGNHHQQQIKTKTKTKPQPDNSRHSIHLETISQTNKMPRHSHRTIIPSQVQQHIPIPGGGSLFLPPPFSRSLQIFLRACTILTSRLTSGGFEEAIGTRRTSNNKCKEVMHLHTQLKTTKPDHTMKKDSNKKKKKHICPPFPCLRSRGPT